MPSCYVCLRAGCLRAHRNRLKVYCKEQKKFVYPEEATKCGLFANGDVDATYL